MKPQVYWLTSEGYRDRIALMIAALDLSGKKWKVTLTNEDESRSSAQNRLLWKWNGEIQAHMRDTHGQVASAEDWHDLMTRRLMPVGTDTVIIDGEEFVVGRWRSSKATTKEMSEYMHLLDMYCAESLQLILSHPLDLYHAAMARKAA